MNLCTTDEIDLKTNVIDGSIVDGVRQPFLYIFLPDILSGFKIFSEPQTMHYEKLNEPVLNTTTFF